MLVIPAIDLKDGKCVRLRRGVFDDKTVYSPPPQEVAADFEKFGAKYLHIVDLDGAQTGTSKNRPVVERILREVTIPVELGGGIRTLTDVSAWLSLGVARVIVGTMAVARPEDLIAALHEFGPEKLVLAVDARNGRVAIEGWQKDANVDVLDLALKFKSSGLRRVLYTDIQRDGMFSGPNFEATKEVALRSGLKVIASGGVSSKEDLQRLAELEPFGVDSVVVGRAFYENKLSAEEVLGAG